MPILGGTIPLRKRLEVATDAIQQLREGRPDRFPLQKVQAVINDLLESRRQVVNSEKCDQFLIGEIDQFKDELYFHEAAIIASCHALSYDKVRNLLVSIQPNAEYLCEHFLWKLKAYIQCLFLCHKGCENLFRTSEIAAIIELLHIVLPARDKQLRPVWKLLRVVGDGKVLELFPITFVKQALVYCDYWTSLNSKLINLQASRSWSEAWVLMKGIRHAAGSPQIQEILRKELQSYSMWAAWNPNVDRINEWNVPILLNHREQLAMILDLEGPDTTGKQHSSLRGALLDHDDSVKSRALHAVTIATQIGNDGVLCLVELCASNRTLTKQNIDLLEFILELGAPGRIAQARGLLRFSWEYASARSVNHRISIIVSALSALQNAPRLQRLFGSAFDLPRYSYETLAEAQKNFYVELQKDIPNTRLAHNISELARALVSASWLKEYWTPGYFEMLSQVPSKGDLTMIIKNISRTNGSTRGGHVAFLADKLCAGPRINSSAHIEPLGRSQPEDPIWSIPMDIDRERLRQILRGMNWVDRATTTACVKRSGDEEDSFIQELNTIINDDTDQVCVNLARFLGPIVVKSGSLDPCWKHLLLSMMRRRPEGLLDRLGESQSLQSWQGWLNNLQRIYRGEHLDPEGQLGFTKAKIMQWQQRKMSLGRTDSDASTATRSTGSFSFASDLPHQRQSLSRRISLHEPGNSLTIPSPDILEDSLLSLSHEKLPGRGSQPQVVTKSEQSTESPQRIGLRLELPTVQTETVTVVPTGGNGRGVPWYEYEIDLLNAFKSSVTLNREVPRMDNEIINDDEDIYN
ncbi:hypothetical protein F5Y19DRAFT_16083 [Xylariaceae sp. FL1651]|nr:hypothetical protein F5Y19DRAFT_16083 [Xylariaceae sp. FL1651]